MRVMEFRGPGAPLELVTREVPRPGRGEVLVQVSTCGVCRTDLHLLDGELPDPRLPVVPGHEVVGRVVALGEGVADPRLSVGTRVGIPWLAWTCGSCEACDRGQENLCEQALFTGYTRDGGYADFTVADQRYCFPLPSALDDLHAAPLLCAGLIGYRSLALAGDAPRIGLYGFGAAAHIIAQIALHQGREVAAFVRPGDVAARSFAQDLGVTWAGDSDQLPDRALDAAILFAPVGALVPAALRAIRPGGTVVCAGIHMSDVPAFPYEILWREKVLRSVANLTRRDAEEFFPLAAEAGVVTHVKEFDLTDANVALEELRGGHLSGAGVLRVSPP